MEKNLAFSFEKISSWLNIKSHPILISGPCSAESREQVMETARLLYQTGKVSAFRSGVWKPRTRPNSFEGHGEKALDWLKEVNETFDFPLVVEVATPKHVELCLKAGVHILWIGARTSVNPFSIQELAEALKGTDIPLMIKNPVNPDLNLWMGVIERFYQSGIRKIAAVHRGFNTYGKMRLRNEPLWDIPIELKRIFPDLPLICDPSHIAGKRSLLFEVAQQALFLDMDGLMIESHPDPSKALTDSAQQIKPADLAQMIENLRIPESNIQPCQDLEKLRSQIDGYDNQLVDILAMRMRVVNQIAEVKKNCSMTVLQVKRWNQIIKSRLEHAEYVGLEKNFIKELLELIHKESIRIQSQIFKK